MVPPAERGAADGDVVERVVEVRREDADRIDRQHDPGELASAADEQGKAAGDFAEACDEDDLVGPGHPGGGDLDEAARRGDVEQPGDDEGGGKDAAYTGLGRQTVKLSPQPQLPLALGFWKVKPSVKSSSTQSIVEPIR